jgi:hypothetical protein
MSDIHLIFDHEVKINLHLTGHRLIAGYTGDFRLPVETSLSLYAVKEPQNPTKISNAKDLSRIVSRIDNEEQAWAFLRLFTSVQTHYLFQTGVYTVDVEVAETRSVGQITPEVAGRVSYKAPSMGAENGVYRTVRDLARGAPGAATAALVRRAESVSVGGKYAFDGESIITNFKPGELVLPEYE